MFARRQVVIRIKHHWCVVAIHFERSPFPSLRLGSDASPNLRSFLGIVVNADWPSSDACSAQAFECLLDILRGGKIDEAVRRVSPSKWIDGYIDIITDIIEYEAITEDDAFGLLTFRCCSS